jgi:hypothetical protein
MGGFKPLDTIHYHYHSRYYHFDIVESSVVCSILQTMVARMFLLTSRIFAPHLKPLWPNPTHDTCH